MNQLAEYLQNPKSIAIKKFFATLLQQKYFDYDELLTRVSISLVTDNDVKSFAKMINEIYQIGYQKAADDYNKQLEKAGIKIINQQKKDGNPL